MATTKAVFSLLLILSSFTVLLFPHCYDAAVSLKVCKFDAIYQLGDSISDTGNLIRENPKMPCARLPYGEIFFKKPTGRCSNGLLMIDYIAQAAGIPFLDPYLKTDAMFTRGRGVNFAVVGSTALPTEVLAHKHISAPATNSSLSVQLDWMFTHFNSICRDVRDCAEKLKTALFMVGEIGGNDFNYAFFQGKSIEEQRKLVPEVVRAIKDAVTRVIGYGAVRIVVPGNFPIGCLPVFLTTFHTKNSADYDKFHCLNWLNNFSIYFNDQLKLAIEGLKKANPHVTIVYGDYYIAFQSVYQNALHLGFDAASVQKCCCGIGGEYDFSKERRCGDRGVPVCPNPDKRISWDGIHMTQKAYQYMALWLINDILPKLHCTA